MRKAQASTEYLIILAVVIIVALIVVGVMGWFPGVSGAITEQESQQYWKGMASPFSIQDYKYSGTTLTLSLKNMGTDKLSLTGVSVGGTSGTITTTNFTAGETKTVNVTSVPNCGSTGDKFSVNLVFTYTNLDSGITGNTQTGEKPLVGKCS